MMKTTMLLASALLLASSLAQAGDLAVGKKNQPPVQLVTALWALALIRPGPIWLGSKKAT